MAKYFPQSATLPTGLGKTMVMAVWLLTTAPAGVRVPRRLVYFVNHCTVVDQSTREAEKLRDEQIRDPDIERRLLDLCRIPFPHAICGPLAVGAGRYRGFGVFAARG